MELSASFSLARLAKVSFVALLCLIAVSIEAAPLGLSANAYPSPDIVFCVVAYWSTRRAETVPLLAVFALGLARDLVTDAPVGAGALTLALASEFLKSARSRLARRSFGFEWLLIAAVFALVLLAQWLAVLMTLAHPPYLVELVRQWFLTMMVYPPLALIFRWLFGIGWRKLEAAPRHG